ncbi:uncharacterized protein LOC141640915 [Silene latifolia]|uniref:uncharacterized protein LOC141640915 n=1 Tax=Silene latifolia TaxID=37657 RepID=UPI003D7701B6
MNEEATFEEEPNQEMIMAHPDTGHSLVLWRVMHSQQAPLEEGQRSLIFRSRCTIQGRVCNLIIDGGSCTNVASVTMVNKLNLSNQEHPNPYKLRWLNKGAEVKVDKQCLVPFLIGNVYIDEILCDMVLMDACHLLLGRPWEFDKNSIHQGRSNTYSFKQGSKKITLTPLPPNLKNYRSPTDVFPAELPTLRGIKHQIDLIPGPVLPNRPAYRCVPDATRELQNQIDELMNKRFVRKSLSPCAVPALLVPKKDGTWRMCSHQQHHSQIDAIKSWPIPKNITEVRGFHGLASFYRRFIKNFSAATAPITECIKKGEYKLTENAHQPFNLIKRMLCEAPILRLPDFSYFFEVECDASGVGIGVVLIQERKHFAYFSEKLSGAKLSYSTYDKEFYAIVKALMHWSHYLKPKPFVLHSDHEALKYINGLHKLNHGHAKWVEFLQSFTFSSKYKEGEQNIVADALSRRYSLLLVMEQKVPGFEFMKELYKDDPYFYEDLLAQTEATKIQGTKFLLQESFLFHGNKLCVPRGSYRDQLIKEVHSGGLGGHFGVQNVRGEPVLEGQEGQCMAFTLLLFLLSKT